MIRLQWGVTFLLFVIVVLTGLAIILAQRKGYFLSLHSLRLRVFLGQLKLTPFRLFVNLVSRVRPGEVLVTRFRGVARAIAYGVLGFVVALICITMLPWTVGSVIDNNLTSHIDTVWQVHATLTGFSVVALVFVWETLESTVQASQLVGEMTEKQGLLDRIYFLVIANLFIGVGLFLASPLSQGATVANTPVQNQQLGLLSVVLVVVFLVVSAWELLQYYENIHTLLFKKGPNQAALDLYQQQLEEEKGPDPTLTYGEIIESRVGVELSPYMSLLPVMGRSTIQIQAEEIDAGGKKLTDINLSGLRTIAENIDEDADLSFWYRLGEQPRNETSIMRAEAELSETERARFVDVLRDNYKFES